jgi:hypothetical protein
VTHDDPLSCTGTIQEFNLENVYSKATAPALREPSINILFTNHSTFYLAQGYMATETSV